MLSTKYLAKKVAASRWYHQGFDGTPLLISYNGRVQARPDTRLPRGMDAKWLLFYFKNERAEAYLDYSDLERGTDIILKLTQKSDAVSLKLMKKWSADEKKFKTFFENFCSLDLTVKSDSELCLLYNKFYNLISKRLSSTSIIDHFALGSDQLLAGMIREQVGLGLKE